MRKKFTQKEINSIIELYNKGLNCSEIAKKYNRNRTTINFLLRRNNIKIRNNKSETRQKYLINQDYFDFINSEQKAYFLGLIYADGTNSLTKNMVRLSLAERDIDILKKLKKEIGTNRPLLFTETSKRNKNWQNTYTLCLSNKKISEQLTKLGCVPAKTKVLKFPAIEIISNSLLRHFIRGYFDGDGHFGIANRERKNKKYYSLVACVVSTEEFCKKLQSIIKSILNINSYISKRYKDKETTIRQLRISGSKQVFKLESWLYHNSNIYMNRKYKTYLKHKKFVSETGKKRTVIK
jgi:intein-encoded DNA endonuclease-like protein